MMLHVLLRKHELWKHAQVPFAKAPAFAGAQR
jgi:hypothetical protein